MSSEDQRLGEYSLSDVERWSALNLKNGDYIEVTLDPDSIGNEETVIAGFILMDVMLVEELTISAEAKSLGCADPEITKRLSTMFNRKQGFIHFCSNLFCLHDQRAGLHVTALKVHGPTLFQAPYITATTARQAEKWQGEVEAKRFGKHPGQNEEGASTKGAPARASVLRPPREGVEKGDALRRAGKGPDAPPKKVRKDPKAAGIDRAALRGRLESCRQRMRGDSDGGALRSTLEVGEVMETLEISSTSDGYSPSVLDESLTVGNNLPLVPSTTEEKRMKKRRDPKKPNDGAPYKPIPVPVKKEKKHKKHPKDRPREEGSLQVATRGAFSSSSSKLQHQLLARAVAATEEKRDKHVSKEKKRKKEDVGKQLVKILTKTVKEPKKRKKRKRKEEGDPYGDPEDSSSYQTESYEEGSEDSKAGVSEEEKLEAPLRRKSKKKPGSVLQLLVDHAKSQLDQTSKVAVGAEGSSNLTQGVKIASYFSICLKQQIGASLPQLRELHFLSNAVDLLRQGSLDLLGDTIAARFMAIHQAALDGSWTAARHLELVPYEESSAAGPGVLLRARRFAKLQQKLWNTETWSGKGGGKGRGKQNKGGAWQDADSSGDFKGKGKKGGRGKGRGKPWWAQYQGEGDGGALRGKEKEKEK